MKHSKLREMLELWLQGDLGPAEEFLLEEHLRRCRECRDERAELESFHKLIEGTRLEPSEDLLDQARRRLHLQLRDSASKASRRSRGGRQWREWLRRLVDVGFSMPQAALASAGMLLVGLVAGYAFFTSPAATPSLDSTATIANLRIFEDPSSQELELVFDEVRPVRLKGTAQDERVRSLLAYAAVYGNPGVRLKAFDEMDRHFESFGRSEIKKTLIASLVADENPGVRRRALESLQKLPYDKEIERALLAVLRFDPNPGLRVDAINVLEGAALGDPGIDSETLRLVREHTSEDENPYVRRRSQSLLQEVDYR